MMDNAASTTSKDEELSIAASLSAITKTAILGGLDEYEKTYQRATDAGLARNEAQVEALSSMHKAQERIFLERAAQASATGDPKLASLLADSALHARDDARVLSESVLAAKETLEVYAQTRSSNWAKLVGDSPALKVLRKYGGPVGDSLDLSLALINGSKGDVAKSVTGIAFSSVVTALARAAIAGGVAGPVGSAALVIAVVGTISMEFFVTGAQWDALAEPFKEAIAEIQAGMRDMWQGLLRTLDGTYSDVSELVNEAFLSALNLLSHIDPLTLDLDGDGIETLGVDAGVLFDFDGDGIKTGTGWIKGDDGFLVLDRNGNGQIDSGRELFGVDTVKRDGTKARNGFDALADLDSNGDGLFDENDEMYSSVRVWQDINHDGIAQAGELKTLREHHIAAIILKSKEANQDSNGNLISATGSYIRDDGSEGEVNGNQSVVADVDLESNPFYSEHADHVALDDEVKKLPTLQGSGRVRELQEAAMLSATLRDLLGQFSASGSHREQRSLMSSIVGAWASTGVDFQSFDERIDNLDRDGVDFRFAFSWEAAGKAPTAAQSLLKERFARLSALEAFNGQPFMTFEIERVTATSVRLVARMGAIGRILTLAVRDGVVLLTEADLQVTSDQWSLLDNAYGELSRSIEGGLLLQTRLREYADLVDIDIAGETLRPSFDRVVARLEALAATDPVKATFDALDLTDAMNTLGAKELAAPLARWLAGLSPSDLLRLREERAVDGTVLVDGASAITLNGSTGRDVLFGGAGSDKLYGDAGNDWLFGGDHGDKVYGGDGNDILVGGAGDDQLEGGAGSDTYFFDIGDGNDVIVNNDNGTGRFDVLQFGANVKREDLTIRRSSTHLVFRFTGAGDSVVVENFFLGARYQLNEIRFFDGSTLLVDEIKRAVLVSTDGDDYLVGYGDDDTLFGGLGRDTMYGGNGNDTLDGGAGNDTLLGDLGDDMLVGGAGDDLLDGGHGSDVYAFGRGHGNDTIKNFDISGSRDAIQYLDGIRPGEIHVQRSGSGLLLTVEGTTDRIFVDGYFSDNAFYHVHEIRFDDGTVWSRSDVELMAIVPTDGNDTILGYDGDDILSGGLGNDTLAGNAGNDTLDGGSGDDSLSGNDGSDVLTGGSGNDRMDGGIGSDTYVFGRGHGSDTIKNFDTSASKDIIRYADDIRPDEISAKRSGDDLILSLNGNVDRIVVSEYFSSNAYYHLDEIHFADGTIWARKDVEPMVIVPTDGNDTLIGYGGDDVLAGGLGNDSLSGYAGNDVLDGGDGDDGLSGGDGDDVLIGGSGNDRMDGGLGADTYVLGRGHGIDRISNFDTSAGKDVVQYLEGIDPSDIEAIQNGGSLVLAIRGTNDRVTIDNFFSSNRFYHVDEVRFHDGTVWDRDAILGKLTVAPAGMAAASVDPLSVESDLHRLISAMTATGSPETVTPPVPMSANVNWASLAV